MRLSICIGSARGGSIPSNIPVRCVSEGSVSVAVDADASEADLCQLGGDLLTVVARNLDVRGEAVGVGGRPGPRARTPPEVTFTGLPVFLEISTSLS